MSNVACKSPQRPKQSQGFELGRSQPSCPPSLKNLLLSPSRMQEGGSRDALLLFQHPKIKYKNKTSSADLLPTGGHESSRHAVSPRQSESLCGGPGDHRAAGAQGTNRGGRVGSCRAQHPTPGAQAVALWRLDAVTSGPAFHSAWGPGDKSPGERRSRHNFSPAGASALGEAGQVSGSIRPTQPAPSEEPGRGALAGAELNLPGDSGEQAAGPAPKVSTARATPPEGPAPQPRPASARCSRDSGCGAHGAHGFPR